LKLLFFLCVPVMHLAYLIGAVSQSVLLAFQSGAREMRTYIQK